MTFGQQIQQLRKDKGYSQDKLAGMLYVTRQSVSQWENDRAMPSIDLLLKLSQIFDISVDELLGREEEAAPICSADVLCSPKEIAQAASFKFRSTIALLFSVALAVIAANAIKMSIYPAIYKGLPFYYTFSSVINSVLIIAALAVSITVLFIRRKLFQKRATVFAGGLAEQADFFSDSLLLYSADGTSTSFFYANLRRIYENDNFLYITLPNKQTVIFTKEALGEACEPLMLLLRGQKSYGKKLLVHQQKRQLNVKTAKLLQTLNNVLFVLCIAGAPVMISIRTKLMTNDTMPGVLRWMLYLLPWVLAIGAVILGVLECIRHIQAKRLIFGGVASLTFLCVLCVITNVFLPVYQFNQRPMSADEFCSVMEEHNMTVSEANMENPDDFLWECYKAVSEDGNITVTFMHFQEEPRWGSIRAARGAYDRYKSTEIAKTNEANVFYGSDLILNAYLTVKSNNNRFFYLSQNCYTVICISSEGDRVDEVNCIFSDYLMEMPY